MPIGIAAHLPRRLRHDRAMDDDPAGYARELRTHSPEDDTAVADVAEVWLEGHEHLARPIAEVVIGRLRANTRLFPLTEALALVDEGLSDAEFVAQARAGMSEHGWLPAQVVEEALRRLETALEEIYHSHEALAELARSVWPVLAACDTPEAAELRARIGTGEFDR